MDAKQYTVVQTVVISSTVTLEEGQSLKEAIQDIDIPEGGPSKSVFVRVEETLSVTDPDGNEVEYDDDDDDDDEDEVIGFVVEFK